MGFWIALIAVVVVIALMLALIRAVNRDYIHPAENIEITSASFQNGGMMPIKYTGNGEDISPQLTIHNIDSEAKTIAVLMDDLDTPFGIFNHWVLFNIPSSINMIPEGVERTEVISSLGDVIQGKSSYGGKHYYRGPKPPFGTHRYEFKVYVLDVVLELGTDTTKRELQKAMSGHVLQFGKFVGRYSTK